jgi:hypothetical protein
VGKHLRLIQSLPSAIALLALAFGFQNCSQIKAEGGGKQENINSAPSNQGGTGLDGDRYVNFAVASNNQVHVKNEIIVASDHSRAHYVKQNFTELPAPVSIDVAQLKFSTVDPSTLVLNNDLFNLWNSHRPKVTIMECVSTNGPLSDLVIRQHLSSVGQLDGIYGLADGSISPDLNVQALANGGYQGSDVAGDDMFTLTTSPIAFSYSHGAGSGLQSNGVNCFTQPAPAPGFQLACHK